MVIHIMVCGENFFPLCFGGFTQRVSRRAFKSADGFAWEYSGIIAAKSTSAAQRRVLQLRPQLPEDICIWGRTYLTGGLAASPVTSRKVYTPYALYICGTETEDVQ
jgi:hypothetical protein